MNEDILCNNFLIKNSEDEPALLPTKNRLASIAVVCSFLTNFCTIRNADFGICCETLIYDIFRAYTLRQDFPPISLETFRDILEDLGFERFEDEHKHIVYKHLDFRANPIFFYNDMYSPILDDEVRIELSYVHDPERFA